MLAFSVLIGAAACILLVARGRLSALPGLLMGALFAVTGFFGGQLWNWARETNGAGLPAMHTADTAIDGVAGTAFLFAASGAFAGAALIATLLDSRPAPKLTLGSMPPGLAWTMLVGSGVVFVFWLLGQGPNLWYRELYLESDGIQVFLTMTTVPGPLGGLLVFFLVAAARISDTLTGLAWFSGIAWFVVCISMGTRVAVGFPVVAGYLVCRSLLRRRTILRALLTVPVLYVATFMTLATFAVTLYVRSRPHGLSLVVDSFMGEGGPSPVDVDSWVPTIQRLVSSITASHVISEYSAIFHPSAELLINNANPLPAGLANVDPITQERMMPYTWTPLAFVGEWYGALGGWAQFSLYAVVAGYAAWAVQLLHERKQTNILLVACIIPLMVALTAMQYPSRNAWRFVSITFAIPLIIPVLWLIEQGRTVPQRFRPSAFRSKATSGRLVPERR